MRMQEKIFFTSSLFVRLPHLNRSCRRPAELKDSVHDSAAEGVHPLQLAQHVWTDGGLRHLQVRPGSGRVSCKHFNVTQCHNIVSRLGITLLSLVPL